MVSSLFLVILGLFSTGGCIMIAGIVTQSSTIMYVSAGVSSVGILLSVYFCVRDRRQPAVFENPVFPPRLYSTPGMKKNKSDTNLELMGAPKNTNDDAPPIV